MLDNHYVPSGYGILPIIEVFGVKISSYALFVGLGLFVGIIWFFISVPRRKNVSHENAVYIFLSALGFGLLHIHCFQQDKHYGKYNSKSNSKYYHLLKLFHHHPTPFQ